MSGVAGRLAKPQLRGHASSYLMKAVPASIGFGILSAGVWKWGYAEPSKRAYAEFYS